MKIDREFCEAHNLPVGTHVQAILHPSIRSRWASAQRFTDQGFVARQGDDGINILMDGIVGIDFTPRLLRSIMRDADSQADLRLDINSPGGLVEQGLAIHNMLREHRGTVNVNVIGAAASAAQFIAMAGDRVLMGQGTYQMIHNASAIVAGNAKQLTRAVQALQKIDDGMVAIISGRSQMTAKQVRAKMDETTYFNAEQAIELGLADGYMPTNDKSTGRAQAQSVAQISGATPDQVDPKIAALKDDATRVLEESRALRNALGG